MVAGEGMQPEPRSPEDLFLAWLCDLDDRADIAGEAVREIARIDDLGERSDDIQQLRAMLMIASRCLPQPTGRRNRSHH
jgi:hypothetical protein